MKKWFLFISLIWLFLFWWNLTNASSSYCESKNIPLNDSISIVSKILEKEWDTKKINELIISIENSLNKINIYSLDYIKKNWIDENIYTYICKWNFNDKEKEVLVSKIQKYFNDRELYMDNISNYYIFKNWLVDEKYRNRINDAIWSVNLEMYGKKSSWLDKDNWILQTKTYGDNSVVYLSKLKKNIKDDKDIKTMFTPVKKMSNYCITGNIPLNDSWITMESILKEEWDSKKIITKVKTISKNMDSKWVYSLDYVKEYKLTSINKYICKNNLSLEKQNILVEKLQTYLNERSYYNDVLIWFYATKEAYSDKKYRTKLVETEKKLRNSNTWYWMSDEDIKKSYQKLSTEVNNSFAKITKTIKSDKDIRWMFWLK